MTRCCRRRCSASRSASRRRSSTTIARGPRRCGAAIARHFGATIDGFETYRYYDGNTTLRAWIATPLTVGIYDRARGTTDALFSPRLWTKDGLATEAGKPDFWDRSTLYALRGVFAAGDTERALQRLSAYTHRRLLGEHVPYAVEAYPEGGQAHLSAESALYCRIFVEGMFGIRPAGLNSFTLTPRLPAGWDRMSLRAVHAFGRVFDVEVTPQRADMRVRVAPIAGRAIERTVPSGRHGRDRLLSHGATSFDGAPTRTDARSIHVPVARGGQLLISGQVIESPETGLRYRIERLLGEGGFGQAYLATRQGRVRRRARDRVHQGQPAHRRMDPRSVLRAAPRGSSRAPSACSISFR